MEFVDSINDKLIEVDPLDKLKHSNNALNGEAQDGLRASQGTDKLDRYSSFLEPQDKEEYSAIRLKLIQAGYRTKSAVKTYHFAQFALGITLLVVGVAFAIYSSATGEPSTC